MENRDRNRAYEPAALEILYLAEGDVIATSGNSAGGSFSSGGNADSGGWTDTV